MPISRQARMMRTAISPRLAIRTRLNMKFLDRKRIVLHGSQKGRDCVTGLCDAERAPERLYRLRKKWKKYDPRGLKPARDDKNKGLTLAQLKLCPFKTSRYGLFQQPGTSIGRLSRASLSATALPELVYPARSGRDGPLGPRSRARPYCASAAEVTDLSGGRGFLFCPGRRPEGLLYPGTPTSGTALVLSSRPRASARAEGSAVCSS